MSVTRTYTVTVASTDSGNKYVIDGVQQDTLYLAETGTYVFNYPSAHPFRFSTTSDGTHNSGSEYTTGVTVNSSTQVQITVAASAPTLYYYCSIHSGMGGTANTPSEDTWGALGWDTNSWGISSLTVGWGADTFNDPASTWGDVGDEIVSLTAPDAISSKVSVGSAWGDDTWGEEQSWGQFTLNVADVIGVSGVSSTSAVGSVSFTISATVSVSGVASTLSVGSLTPADVMGLSGVSSTSAVGSISPADVMGLSGISSTSDVGTISIASNPVVNISGVQITSAVGAIDPSAQVVGLDGVSFTASVGSLVPADVMGLTGQEFTASVTSTIGIQAYQDIDTGSNSSYTNVATGSNTSYSDAA
tara:strand:- start:134 stop:1213 length:1080 start_codon:yes stop_codon:yes gene_type:complete